MWRRFFVLVVAVAIALCNSICDAATQVTVAAHHFSVTFPDDWEDLKRSYWPPAFIDKPNFVRVFKSKGKEAYIGLCVAKGPADAEEAVRFARDIERGNESALSVPETPKGARIVRNLAEYEADKSRITGFLEVAVDGIPKYVRRDLLKIGKEDIAGLVLVCPMRDFTTFSPQLDALYDGLRFDAGYETFVAAAAKKPGMDMLAISKVVGGVALVVIVGGLVAYQLVKRRAGGARTHV